MTKAAFKGLKLFNCYQAWYEVWYEVWTARYLMKCKNVMIQYANFQRDTVKNEVCINTLSEHIL